MSETKKLKILSLDDKELILKIIREHLKSDFDVATKLNGREALKWMEEGNIPDLIISDLNMPDMDGFEFMKQVRASSYFRTIPIVLLSGAENVEKATTRVQCLNAGANDFLLKPFNPEELKAVVKAVLRTAGKLPYTV